MTRFIALMVVVAGLAACEESVGARDGTFTHEGQQYRSVTRTFQSGDRSYDRRTVYVGAKRITCSATDDADCASAIDFSWAGGSFAP